MVNIDEHTPTLAAMRASVCQSTTRFLLDLEGMFNSIHDVKVAASERRTSSHAALLVRISEQAGGIMRDGTVAALYVFLRKSKDIQSFMRQLSVDMQLVKDKQRRKALEQHLKEVRQSFKQVLADVKKVLPYEAEYTRRNKAREHTEMRTTKRLESHYRREAQPMPFEDTPMATPDEDDGRALMHLPSPLI